MFLDTHMEVMVAMGVRLEGLHRMDRIGTLVVLEVDLIELGTNILYAWRVVFNHTLLVKNSVIVCYSCVIQCDGFRMYLWLTNCVGIFLANAI